MRTISGGPRKYLQDHLIFWISQIFWLTLTFGILYVVLSKLILPKISANLESRKSQISDNIEAADKQREESEAKLREYEEIVSKSKIEAKKKINCKNGIITVERIDRQRRSRHG